jgi:small neutral amino acid transporter SnatA (MarC family)
MPSAAGWRSRPSSSPALNLLAMLYAREILRTIGIMPLQILGAMLSVLQIALGVQMILWALAMLEIFEGSRF